MKITGRYGVKRVYGESSEYVLYTGLDKRTAYRIAREYNDNLKSKGLAGIGKAVVFS